MMCLIKYLKFIGLYIVCVLIRNSRCNDVLGCGGYVRSEVEIDYSQVRIKLLTQHGNLKYETECAPNNGYYFIRLYDKGEYVLKVSPPSGWSFEPEEVILKVDGESDPCSLSRDINFFFKGFAVVGRVVSLGSDVGPPGVTVVLKQGEKEVLRTVTSEEGDYIFSPLAGGFYDVVATHPTWNIIKNKVSVNVSDKNGNAGSSLVVGGYSVWGAIDVSGPVSEKLRFALHSAQEVKHNIGCVRESVPLSYQNKMQTPVLCHAPCDARGRFTFSSLPLGKYTVVPFFLADADTKYNLEPSSIEVEVGHKDFQIQQVFKVKGKSLHGRVLMGTNSPPLKGARVTLVGGTSGAVVPPVRTDDEGRFAFHGVAFGVRVLKVEAEGVEFDEVKTELRLESLPLSSIVPVRYETCFSVSVDTSSDLNIPWLIHVAEGRGSKHEVQTSSAGVGCLFLPAGEYKAVIALTAGDEEAGIRFGPREHVFKVENERIPNLSFSQFLGEIEGAIACLESCRALTVSLRPSRGNSGSPRTTTTSSQGRFAFAEVVPGEYLLSVDKEEWCWREQTLLVAVDAKNVSARFEQKGFRLTLNASHRTTLSYVTNKGHAGKLDVAEGTSRECVAAPGKYVFTPTSCHKFGAVPLTWDTAAPQLLSLTATHHQVAGTLMSSEAGPFSITVKSDGQPESVIGPLQPSSTDKNIYTFETWLESGDTVALTPSSSSNLFQYNPPSFTLKVADDCMISVVQFHAERALFLKGYVKPALKGVSIRVSVGTGEEEEGGDSPHALMFTTNAEGFFMAGPLDKTRDYTVTAGKAGYVINPPLRRVEVATAGSEVVKMSFEAHKLAEIIVRIGDAEGRPLEGVLVSTSGGKDYRQNSLTEADGSFAFQSLMPGDYFLRPMMKEYTFQPASKMVKVEGGATLTLNISGVRVAYSIFGQTVSLSGEPEGDVVMEAVGSGPDCAQLQEEALADATGHFRIRGLRPNCDYALRLKKGLGVNEHVDRCLPDHRTVRILASDHKGVKVVVLRPFLQMDVALFVETARSFLGSLTAELYRDDSPDSPVHVVTLKEHPFFMLPPMIMDRQTYFVQLVSSLSHSLYSYSLPSVAFTANESFVHLNMEFRPQLKSVDAEISRGTVFGLMFFVLTVSVALNYNKIRPLLERGAEMYCAKSNAGGARNGGGGGNGKQVSSSKTAAQMPIPGDSAFIEPVTLRKRVKVRKT